MKHIIVVLFILREKTYTSQISLLLVASLVLSETLDISDNQAKSYGGALYVKNDEDCSFGVLYQCMVIKNW